MQLHGYTDVKTKNNAKKSRMMDKRTNRETESDRKLVRDDSKEKSTFQIER